MSRVRNSSSQRRMQSEENSNQISYFTNEERGFKKLSDLYRSRLVLRIGFQSNTFSVFIKLHLPLKMHRNKEELFYLFRQLPMDLFIL